MLLDRLRNESRAPHTRLEESVGLATTLEHHQALVRGFFGFIKPWEETVSRSPHASLLSGREKTPLLREDLRHAGFTAEDIDRLPLCAELPDARSLATILGTLYVLEGSTLGGQMISRHLEAKLGLTDGQGYRYFRGYGAETPRKWQEFRQLLLSHSSPENDDRIVASAQETFERLYRWFTRNSANTS